MNLSYATFSKQSKSPVLFLHGNLASRRWWTPTIESWIAEGSTGNAPLIAADWRGCGENEPWPADQPFSLQDLAEDHLRLLENLDVGPCALVGHSLGGLIAMQMMLLAPKMFTRAVLLDPVGAKGVVFDPSMYAFFEQMAKDPEFTRNVVLSTILNAQNLSEDMQRDFGADAYRAIPGIGTKVLEILKTVDLSEELKSMNIPTLLLHGVKDGVIPLKGGIL